MRHALTLGLAGLLVIAPALRGQERLVSRSLHSVQARNALVPAPTSLTLRPPADSASAAWTIPHRASADPSPHPRLGKIVTWALVGAVAGGTIAYYTYEPTYTNCSGFQCYDLKARMVKGALIGGSAGFALGALVTLGEGRPKLVMR